ncbi:MAG: hypothetical protein KDI09_06700 [Halioglobus sp.]|nr:hypothetical protein [Halioglobus sp.]
MLALAITASLSGCLFEVADGDGQTYAIDPGGSVDARLASRADLDTLTFTGYFLTSGTGSRLEVRLNCLRSGVMEALVPFPGAIAGGIYELEMAQAPGDFSELLVSECDAVFDAASQSYEFDLAFTVLNPGTAFDGSYMPVLTAANLGCISGAVAAGSNALAATESCLAVDPRGAISPLGINPPGGPVGPENVLSLSISADVYDALAVAN